MTSAEFLVEVSEAEATRFAELSGDWNPLHTDPEYASRTSYRRPILHGAYSAGLVSRMAGMHIPGQECLLHSIKLKFISPIVLPATLRVYGTLVRGSGTEGIVEVQISDISTGARYVEGSYEFGHHSHIETTQPQLKGSLSDGSDGETPILVTGASGGLGSAMIVALGGRGLPIPRGVLTNIANLPDFLNGRKIGGIVHCGWPTPDNQRLTDLGSNTEAAIRHHVASPLVDCLKLAQALVEHGIPGATLVLVGSTAAQPGRHNWRAPLYSLSKSLIPSLVQILALELGSNNQRCVGAIFDVIDGGMNAGIRESVRIAHADRSPVGKIATPVEAAFQLSWLLQNNSFLMSGAVMTLSGGAMP